MPFDYTIITNIIESKSRVLDLGCGNGALMLLLKEEKQAQVQGIEIDEKAIYACVEKGLSVFHGDIDSGLSEYPDKSFDYVVLNQSMQQVKKAKFVIHEALRVGRKVIIGFPNFAFIPGRLRFCFRGKVPITKSLPYRWYDTPNLHFFSIADFLDFCRDENIAVLETHYVGGRGEMFFLPNLLAQSAVVVIRK